MKKSLFRNIKLGRVLLCLTLASAGLVNAENGKPQQASADQLFQSNCASCHSPDRLGSMGPALLPQNLGRLKKPAAKDVIINGRAATQMPPFKQILNDEQIDQLVDYIFTKPDVSPIWDLAEINKTHVIHFDQSKLSDKPVFDADLQNLFIVVELGDHHATILNGDTFEPIHRFATRFAVHGGPKYTRDGRYVFFASRDGWISKFDMYSLKTVAEIRAGINTRNVAVSPDGKYVMVGNYLPHNLVVLNGDDLSPITTIPTTIATAIGQDSSRISAVYTAPPRNSFIAAMKDIPEVWEISYDETNSKPDFKPRRIKLDDYLDDFFFDQSYSQLIGAARPVNSTGKREKFKGGQVIDLDKGIKTNDLQLPGMPHLGSGITWKYQGRTVLASPNLSSGEVAVIDMETWETIKTIPTKGPGFFMRSHAKSPYAWVDVFFGPNKDLMHIIDKQSLEIVKTLRPEPGKTAAHVEFTKDGQFALVSIWEKEGAVIVYDANTFEEIKRLPMSKPSGKYNVYNKTHFEEGTSH